MEEMLDVFDADGKHVGVKTRSFCHGENPGVYHRAVWVWIVNSNRQVLVQQRSKFKKKAPTKWDISVAGHVDAGESLLDCCVRETFEEVGLETTPKDFVFLGEFTKEKSWEFVKVYLLKCDVKIEDLTLQEEEVEQVAWMNFAEFEKLLFSEDFAPHELEHRKWIAQVLKDFVS